MSESNQAKWNSFRISGKIRFASNPNICIIRVRESDFSRSAGKSVPAESSAISDSSLTVPSHVQRLKHCIYLFPFRIQMFLFGNK
ncbi:unnamed protein product [Staurois parvus]|uniref:Uncharacterized protein n=1 Tax=Staurois parvus TaxID=386267 RepID=A0ABN9FGE0_9NEOB|nr:unnamed protein product [Staurois parvus]